MDKRITDLAEILGANVADDDVLLITDKSDLTDGPDGTSKRISVAELKTKLDINFETILLIVGNDASVDIFTESYLTSHPQWGVIKVGQIVENSQQLAQKTLSGWHISNKNGLAITTLDLDDPLIYSGAAGFETLDILSVNTADIITLIKPLQGASDNIYKIIGGVENREYTIVDGGIAILFKHSASPASGDIVTLSGGDGMFPFKIITQSSINYEWQ